MNVICGENAQGKTNLIEAIWLFCGAKSFRNTSDVSFINFGEQKARCELDFIGSGILNSASIEFNDKRTAFLENKKLASPSLLAGKFNAVIFSPTDLSLIKEGPAVRRKFIDIAIGQIYPNYIEILKSYIRAVTQRNKIIKDFRYDTSLYIMLDVFEDEIAQAGSKIIKYRKKYLEELNLYLPEIYGGISSGKEKIESVYVANCSDNIKEKLEKARKDDVYTGVTSIGPHRDDIDIKINGRSARNYGSQGQQRSVALSLKLSQAETINIKTGEYPVILLDDVMSELDEGRQNYILNHIKGRQSFITVCEPKSVERLNKGKIFTVNCGGVV